MCNLEKEHDPFILRGMGIHILASKEWVVSLEGIYHHSMLLHDDRLKRGFTTIPYRTHGFSPKLSYSGVIGGPKHVMLGV